MSRKEAKVQRRKIISTFIRNQVFKCFWQSPCLQLYRFINFAALSTLPLSPFVPLREKN